jgi:hypothetical protein
METVFEALQDVFFENPHADPEANCMPWAVPAAERCEYVVKHIGVCGEGTGLVPYLKLHYCTFSFRCASKTS